MTEDQQPDRPACAASRCTRPAAPVLCDTDTRRLGDMLAGLGAEYEQLTAAPSMQGREPGTGGGGGLASQRSPARLDVLVLRDERTVMGSPVAQAWYQRRQPKAIGPWCLMCTHETCTEWRAGRQRELHDDEEAVRSDRLMSTLGVLAGWADAVREGRELAARDRRATVTSERKLLSDHMDWVVAQDWAGEFFDEIRALWGLLRQANGHQTGRPRIRCREDGCSGTVRWVDGAAVCSTCGTRTHAPAEEAA